MTVKVNFTILSVLSLLLLTLIGCGNVVHPLSAEMLDCFDDRVVAEFSTKNPLAKIPVAEYTITKDEKGENKLVMIILRQAAGKPKSGVYRAEVTMLDGHRFAVSIPLKESPDRPVSLDYPINLVADAKQGGFSGVWKKSKFAKTDEESQNTEPEESRTELEGK